MTALHAVPSRRAQFSPGVKQGIDALNAEIAEAEAKGWYVREDELAAIGAMLMLSDDAITQGMKRLHRRHFYPPMCPEGTSRNAIIFAAVQRLAALREAPGCTLMKIDAITVCGQLRRMNRIDPDMGSYLENCRQSCACAANIDWYISQVIEASRRRHFARLSEYLGPRAADPCLDSQWLLNATRNASGAIDAHGWADLEAIFEIPIVKDEP